MDAKVNYKSLLKDAQAKWQAKRDKLDQIAKENLKHFAKGGVQDDSKDLEFASKRVDVRAEYQAWVEKNISSKGLAMVCSLNGKPMALRSR